MGRRAVDRTVYLYATKPEIRISRRYRTSVYYDLYNLDGTLYGTYAYGDFPDMVHVENAKKCTEFCMETAPVYRRTYAYHTDMDGAKAHLNGYFYEILHDYYADNGSVELSKVDNSQYSYLRKINRSFFERIKLPEDYTYIDAELVNIISLGKHLDHVMMFKDEYGIFPLSVTSYIGMLLNGEKIRGIEPDSDYIVSIKNIITPKGNSPVQDEIDYYDHCNTLIEDYFYEQLVDSNPYYSQNVDYVAEFPEGSILECSDWKSHVEETIKFTGTSLITMQDIDDLFRTDALYLTEDYNFPLFNVKRHQKNKFPSENKFFKDTRIPIMGKVVKGEIVDDTECVTIEKVIDDNGTIGYETRPFEQVGDLIYDLDYASDEIKSVIIDKYNEFKTIYDLLHSRPLRIQGADNLGHIKSTDYKRFLDANSYDALDKFLDTSYGRIFIHQRRLDTTWTNIKASNYGIYNKENHTIFRDTRANQTVPQRELKNAGLVFGDCQDLLYLDVVGIYETFDGIEIMLAVQALDPQRRGNSIAPLFTFMTNFLVSDLPWVKSGNRYYIHTTLTDLIIPATVFDNLVYEYNVLRPIRDRGDMDGSFIDDSLRRGDTRKFADWLVNEYGEVGIFNFEI